MQVAPVRERGLKLQERYPVEVYDSRSREGAWIEILIQSTRTLQRIRRSREGAWIEIYDCMEGETENYVVAPVRERGLK